MAKKSKLTTLEKFNNAKRDYENNVYPTIEEAAEAHNICPATYYNYNKKIPGQGELSIREIKTGGDDYSALEISKIIDENQKLRRLVSEDKGQIQRKDTNLLDKLAEKVLERILSKI